jgi:hypothetical protein
MVHEGYLKYLKNLSCEKLSREEFDEYVNRFYDSPEDYGFKINDPYFQAISQAVDDLEEAYEQYLDEWEDKTFMVIMTGEDADDAGLVFLQAKDSDSALIRFFEDFQDFDLDDDDERFMVERLLEEYSVGVAEFTGSEDMTNPSFEWYYGLPENE